MQYKVSIPNERSLHCEQDFATVKGKRKWREINIYEKIATLVLIPCMIIGFWRGSWDLLDHYHHFFRPGPTLLVSALIVSILELSRNVYISKHLKILDGDSRVTVLKKNILLSFYDVIYNLANVAMWWVLWGHPEGKFKVHPDCPRVKYTLVYHARLLSINKIFSQIPSRFICVYLAFHHQLTVNILFIARHTRAINV